MNPTTDVVVRGGATAEEIGAILAVLSRSGDAESPLSGYPQWRRQRLQALARRTNSSRRGTSR